MSDMRLVFPAGGVKELSERLSTAAARVGAKAANAVRAGAAQISRDAAAAAPRRSGALAESIQTTFSGSGRSGTMSATIPPTARHAPFVEFGTYKDRPQPFLFPAFERHSEDVLREIADATRDIL